MLFPLLVSGCAGEQKALSGTDKTVHDTGRVNTHESQYESDDIKVRVRAVDALMNLGEPGIEKCRKIFRDGAEAIDLLLEHRENFNKDREKILATAVFRKYYELTRLLLEKGSNPNVPAVPYIYRAAHSFPLMLAFHNDDMKMVELLLEYGAEIKALEKDNRSDSILVIPMRKQNAEIVRLLLANGANPDAGVNTMSCAASLSRSIIHLAVEIDNYEIVKLLVENGAKVDAPSFYERTPLSKAKSTEIAKFLIDNGADVNFADRYGLTPLDHASKNSSSKVIKLFKANGGKTGIELKTGQEKK
jgi:ankyrin repeat protein